MGRYRRSNKMDQNESEKMSLIWDYRTGEIINPETGEVVGRIYDVDMFMPSKVDEDELLRYELRLKQMEKTGSKPRDNTLAKKYKRHMRKARQRRYKSVLERIKQNIKQLGLEDLVSYGLELLKQYDVEIRDEKYRLAAAYLIACHHKYGGFPSKSFFSRVFPSVVYQHVKKLLKGVIAGGPNP